ncbi:MAG: hypothetical protein P8188_03365 [Gemmatimonadota bacterium]
MEASTRAYGPAGRPSPVHWFTGDEGLAGRIALSWALAGGLGLEAILVVTTVVSGAAESALDVFTATLIFTVGAGGGFIHGALLGLTGRPQGVSVGRALRGIEVAAFAALPLGIFAWMAALWISLTGSSLAGGDRSMLLMAAAGWGIFLTLAVWGLAEGIAGLGHALERWPERRPGVILVLALFLTLLVAFLRVRPEIWFTDLRVSELGAVLLAVGATVWIGIPVVGVVLNRVHHWRGDPAVLEG